MNRADDGGIPGTCQSPDESLERRMKHLPARVGGSAFRSGLLSALLLLLGSTSVLSAEPPGEAAARRADNVGAAVEETLPAPRSVDDTGLTLDRAIQACLLNDPRIRSGLEAINQANADA